VIGTTVAQLRDPATHHPLDGNSVLTYLRRSASSIDIWAAPRHNGGLTHAATAI